MDDPPGTAEAIAAALATALVRKGALDTADIERAAADLDKRGGAANETAAHVLRCAALEAHAPPESDWRARRAREQFRIVQGEE